MLTFHSRHDHLDVDEVAALALPHVVFDSKYQAPVSHLFFRVANGFHLYEYVADVFLDHVPKPIEERNLFGRRLPSN